MSATIDMGIIERADVVRVHADYRAKSYVAVFEDSSAWESVTVPLPFALTANLLDVCADVRKRNTGKAVYQS